MGAPVHNTCTSKVERRMAAAAGGSDPLAPLPHFARARLFFLDGAASGRRTERREGKRGKGRLKIDQQRRPASNPLRHSRLILAHCHRATRFVRTKTNLARHPSIPSSILHRNIDSALLCSARVPCRSSPGVFERAGALLRLTPVPPPKLQIIHTRLPNHHQPPHRTHKHRHTHAHPPHKQPPTSLPPAVKPSETQALNSPTGSSITSSTTALPCLVD